MSITLFYGSGSPFAWKVWLALEHKQLPYDLKVLSFQAGDLKKPEFLALNPRAKVPVLVDGPFSLFESTAIVEYLDDRYPERPVIGKDPTTKALARRIAIECDSYLYAAGRKLLEQTLFRPDGNGDPAEIERAQEGLQKEVERIASYSTGGFFVGTTATIADFSAYPLFALMRRIEEKQPGHGIPFPATINAFMKTVEGLPYLAKTVPPHWKG